MKSVPFFLTLLTSATATALADRTLHSQRLIADSSPAPNIQVDKDTGKHRHRGSPNWAGAFQNGTKISHVEATITVPRVRGWSPNAGAVAWVGIDGVTCGRAILQTGIVFNTDGTYVATYEWWPAISRTWYDFDVKAGDQVRMSVDVHSSRNGAAKLENLTTGQVVSHAFTKGLQASRLEFDDGDHISVPLADFDTVTFTKASAKNAKGTITLRGAELYDMGDDETHKYSSRCEIEDHEQLTCRYIKQ